MEKNEFFLKNQGVKKIIQGQTFIFNSEYINGDISIYCYPQDENYIPLCEVVKTSWIYSPSKLINSVLKKHGQSFEGSISFAYYHDYPDELKPGVTFDYLGQEILISEEMFRNFIIEFFNFYLDAKDKLNHSRSAIDEELQSLIKALDS